jgi:hypothetical protein
VEVCQGRRASIPRVCRPTFAMRLQLVEMVRRVPVLSLKKLPLLTQTSKLVSHIYAQSWRPNSVTNK